VFYLSRNLMLSREICGLKQFNSMAEIKDLIVNSNNIAVVIPADSSIDKFCAGVGVMRMVMAKQKNCTFLFDGEIPEDCKDIIGETEVQKELQQRELLVSIDYSGTQASKVHYYTEDQTLYLSVSPINKDFDISKVIPIIKGSDFDLVLSVGVPTQEKLGKFQDVLKNVKLVNFDNSIDNTNYGTFNITGAETSVLSLFVLNNAYKLGLKADEIAAKALLKGIVNKTM